MPAPTCSATSTARTTTPSTPTGTTRCYSYGNYWLDNDGNPIDISQYVQSQNNFTRVTQEIRLVSPADERFRYTVGAFFQRSTHSIEERYLIDDLDDTHRGHGLARHALADPAGPHRRGHGDLRPGGLRPHRPADLDRGPALFLGRQFAEGLLRLRPGVLGSRSAGCGVDRPARTGIRRGLVRAARARSVPPARTTRTHPASTSTRERRKTTTRSS